MTNQVFGRQLRPTAFSFWSYFLRAKLFLIALLSVCCSLCIAPIRSIAQQPFTCELSENVRSSSCCVERMTVEEKVGQIFIVHFQGETASEEARLLIQETKVGGILYYNWANGLHSPEHIHLLSKGLQEFTRQNATPIPLFIAIDQEGGTVSRLQKGFTLFPGNKALGMTGDSILAQEAAFAMGEEMHSVGINLNFAPVVDVNNEPKNPVIGIRSFGACPEEVYSFGFHAVQGYEKAHVLPVLKHFPGHGDVQSDSHEKLPLNQKSLAALEKMEMLPFARLAPYVHAMMTAHILLPALDPDHCATLSPVVLSYLREKIGFQGVIITDSLVMEGVLHDNKTVEEVAIQAFLAGCDILLFGGKQLTGEKRGEECTARSIQKIHHAFVEAVRQGRITEDRLDQSVRRILALKERYACSAFAELCLEGNPFVFDHHVNVQLHKTLAEKIASLAMRVSGKKPIPSLQHYDVSIFSPEILRNDMEQTTVSRCGKKTQMYFFSSAAPSPEERATIQSAMDATDFILFFSYNAWRDRAQQEWMEFLHALDKPIILVVTKDPVDAEIFPHVDWVVYTHSPTTISLQAFCNSFIKI